MKNPKRPTRNQMKVLISAGLHPDHWLIIKKQDHQWELIHKETKELKTITL